MNVNGAIPHMHAATSSNPIDRNLIDLAVEALRRGELVAFPTETVYGLGADASSVEALSRLYQVKGRPAEHPVIVHIASANQLSNWAEEVPESAHRLAEAFWPGPLTMVLRKSATVLGQVTGGQDTVAIRIPGHSVALALLEAFAGGIAAPSANRFGHLSPTTADAVSEELGKDVSLVLNGGPCKVGIESTIVNLSADAPEILRPGMILAEQIEQVLGRPVRRAGEETVSTAAASSMRVPGALPKHYAPRTPLNLAAASDLFELVESLNAAGKRLAVVSFSPDPERWSNVTWTRTSTDSADYAHELYGTLRDLDHQNYDLILVEKVPETPGWAAIRDRLSRASNSESSSGDQA